MALRVQAGEDAVKTNTQKTLGGPFEKLSITSTHLSFVTVREEACLGDRNQLCVREPPGRLENSLRNLIFVVVRGKLIF